jgi:hypothetical protein
MTFCEIYYMMYESNDDTEWSKAMREVKRMKNSSMELYACWIEYCNRSLER